MCGDAMLSSENGSPSQPRIDGPNITLKPINPKPTTLIAKSTVFLMTTLIVFFARIKPASRQLKPACMNNTKQEQKSTQTMSICSISKNPQTVEYFLSEQRTWECLIHQSIRRPELTSTIYQQLRYNEEPTGRTLLSTFFRKAHLLQ